MPAKLRALLHLELRIIEGANDRKIDSVDEPDLADILGRTEAAVRVIEIAVLERCTDCEVRVTIAVDVSHHRDRITEMSR